MNQNDDVKEVVKETKKGVIKIRIRNRGIKKCTEGEKLIGAKGQRRTEGGKDGEEIEEALICLLSYWI